MNIVEEIIEKSNNFLEKNGVECDTMLIGKIQDQNLSNYIRTNEFLNIETANDIEVYGIKIRVVESENDLLQAAMTGWRKM